MKKSSKIYSCTACDNSHLICYSLKDAIEYDTGSIIALDKTENEPVNIYVDDILIAKGKIVAIEDTYGIKIVEIVENKKLEQNNVKA